MEEKKIIDENILFQDETHKVTVGDKKIKTIKVFYKDGSESELEAGIFINKITEEDEELSRMRMQVVKMNGAELTDIWFELLDYFDKTGMMRDYIMAKKVSLPSVIRDFQQLLDDLKGIDI